MIGWVSGWADGGECVGGDPRGRGSVNKCRDGAKGWNELMVEV